MMLQDRLTKLLSSWYISVPIGFLLIFLVYLSIPGSILLPETDNTLQELTTKKILLEEELRDVARMSENSVCEAGELDSPLQNGDNLLPLEEATELLQKLEQGVVLVIVTNPIGEFLGIGSGFFINKNQIVTNGHVVLNSGKPTGRVLVMGKNIGTQEAVIKGAEDNDVSGVDFALLEISEDLGVPLSLVAIEDPNSLKLTEVYAAGFPGSVTESDDRSVPDIVVTDGTISSSQKFFGTISAFIHTAQMSPGNSGGPLVNKCGNVVGINTFVRNDEDGVRNFSLTSNEIKSFLIRFNVLPTFSEKDCK